MLHSGFSDGRSWAMIKGNNSKAGVPAVPVEKHAHPTVLLAAEDEGLRSNLGFNLRQLGCLVLEAEAATRAIEAVISHSRPIQVLVVEKTLDGVGLLETVKRYRPQMRILLVTRDSNGSDPDVLAVDAALAKTRDLLNLPQRRAAAG
jgi:DNA-binding NtrC family response regulator